MAVVEEALEAVASILAVIASRNVGFEGLYIAVPRDAHYSVAVVKNSYGCRRRQQILDALLFQEVAQKLIIAALCNLQDSVAVVQKFIEAAGGDVSSLKISRSAVW